MMRGFLTNVPKFNNSLSDLLFLIFSIKIVSLRSFLLLQNAETLYFQRFCSRNTFVALFKLDMSIDVVLYKWHKINVFVISFSPIIQFISVYLIFCKHIASTKLFLNFPIACLVRSYSFYIFIFFQKSNVVFDGG